MFAALHIRHWAEFHNHALLHGVWRLPIVSSLIPPFASHKQLIFIFLFCSYEDIAPSFQGPKITAYRIEKKSPCIMIFVDEAVDSMPDANTLTSCSFAGWLVIMGLTT